MSLSDKASWIGGALALVIGAATFGPKIYYGLAGQSADQFCALNRGTVPEWSDAAQVRQTRDLMRTWHGINDTGMRDRVSDYEHALDALGDALESQRSIEQKATKAMKAQQNVSRKCDLR